jgi:hypothetical protein
MFNFGANILYVRKEDSGIAGLWFGCVGKSDWRQMEGLDHRLHPSGRKAAKRYP